MLFSNYLIMLPAFESIVRTMNTTDYHLYFGLNLPILNTVSMFL